MAITHPLRGPLRLGYYAIPLLIGAGALLFLALVLEYPPPADGRTG